jgi:RNA polymerase sigma-70 factor (ECF subfamily)
MNPEPQPPLATATLAAFAFERHGQAIQSFLYRLLGKRDEAEALCQEVWVRLLRARPTFESDLALKSWLYRVAKHLAVDQGRRARLRVVGTAEPPEATSQLPDPLAQTTDAEQVQNLLWALDQLAEPYRATLVMRFLQQLGYDEIAAIESVTESALRTRVQKGLRLLRQHLRAGSEATPRGRQRRARV